jgi:CubicO group peptidase (beta-lactamase class C family)
LALGLVQGDRILYLKGYGDADRAGTAVTPQTPFMIASITKTVTALAVQQLAEAKTIDLDAALQSYLPEFQLADPAAAKALTLRHLLDHTSGISQLEGSQSYLYTSTTTLKEALSRLARFRPTHKPGETYEYSNWNYILLGEVIARASSQPYPRYVQTHIFDPLEMVNATCEDPHILAGRAQGNILRFGFSLPYDEPYAPVSLSAGYVSASAEDMAHFLIPYLNHGQYQDQRLLSPQGNGWYDIYWNWQPGTPDDVAYDHSGGHDSFSSNIQIFARHQVGVVVLMNARPDILVPAVSAANIAFNVARIVIDFPHAEPTDGGFYRNYAILDCLLLALAAWAVWQFIRLPRFLRTVKNRPSRALFWAGIGLDLLIAITIALLPGPQWPIWLAHRADVAYSLLAISVALGSVGLIKLGVAVSRPSLDQVFDVQP